jgi:cell division transport system permease protein
VGATDSFVKAPFVIEGSLQGALGATVAVALLGAMFLIVHSRIDGELTMLIGVEPSFLPWPFVLGMVALGGVLGAAAASLGLRRLVQV